MKENKTCPHCGAKMVEYCHSVNRSMALGLVALWEEAGRKPINIKKLGMTRNQWQNFSTLRYWGLIEQITVDGKKKSGVWKITAKGHHFLAGGYIHKKAWSYRGEVMRRDGRMIWIRDVLKDYKFKQRPEYATEALPHKNDKQLVMGI